MQGDYYIPCLILSEEETQPIGLWGQRHKQKKCKD
ncbi:TnpV protein [Roseburia inulinivorans]